MAKLFAPGCGLMIYKPELAEKLHRILNENLEEMDQLLTCCHHQPALESGTEVINVCPGCDRRYRENYTDSTTISIWEIFAEAEYFSFPDYEGKKMSIIDPCPTRNQRRIHEAVRNLLTKMNIDVVEPDLTRTKGICCGDTFWGTLPAEKVREQMVRRTSQMPVDDVVVYCVSCSKSVFIGDKRPHYLIDLLFGEPTIPKTVEPGLWHAELDYFRDHGPGRL